MNLFIDTNILLSFYHFARDDLEELAKLSALVRGGGVNLLLPEQVVSELRRNRASKIADALKRLRDQQLGLQFPQVCKEYEEYEGLRKAQREYERLHTALINRLENDIAQENLRADTIIQELFRATRVLPTSSSVLERARLRMDLGNPPGKKGSLGDAAIWETLLEEVPNGEDLHFVSEDQDYYSPLDNATIDPYLLLEWSAQKGSHVRAYKRISSFFGDMYPDIRLASELEKGQLIEDLANSPSFAQTHLVIGKLSKYSDFTPVQLNAIVAAGVTNSQVYSIASDRDVRRFLTRVVSGKEHLIDPLCLSRLKSVLEETGPHY
jgi:hypothetical protein